jgi:hypothetical protein
MVALAEERHSALVGNEFQPVEIIEQSGFELGAASLPVVIFEPEKDPSVERASHAPHVDGVHHVSEMQVPCGSGRESRGRLAPETGFERDEVRTATGEQDGSDDPMA